jgi:5-oxoprolinase (ATP-hydrolysing) subunit A
VSVVDLNADLGESFGNYSLGQDPVLIPLLNSAHLACGFHASDPRVMDQTVRLCRDAGVQIGAHPGFPDLVGFGRRVMDVSGHEAETDIVYQLGALEAFCRRNGAELHHVKAHGALYNHAARNSEVARGVAAGIASFRPDLLMVCQPGSQLEEAALEAGLSVAYEGFVDRAYNPDGTLASRRLEGTLLHDPKRAIEQALRMVTEGTVVAMDGTVVELHVDTLCVHGDNPDAVDFVSGLRQQLTSAGVELRPMRDVVRLRAERGAPAPRPSGA